MPSKYIPTVTAVTIMPLRNTVMPRRMLRLGHALQAMDAALAARDEARVDALLSGREALPAPLLPAAGHDHLLSGLETAEKLMDIIDGRSRSVHDYGEAALAYFGQGETA